MISAKVQLVPTKICTPKVSDLTIYLIKYTPKDRSTVQLKGEKHKWTTLQTEKKYLKVI